MGARRNPFETARENGRQAYLAGRPRTACPYPDRRTVLGRVTWSRSYRIYWLRGWDAARNEKEQA